MRTALVLLVVAVASTLAAIPQPPPAAAALPVRQMMEALGRGLVGVHLGDGKCVPSVGGSSPRTPRGSRSTSTVSPAMASG